MVPTQNRYKLQLSLLFVLLFSFICTIQVHSQKRYKVYEDYIDKYSTIAVNNMQKHGEPYV